MIEYAYVYILANSFKRLYIGITTDLMVRVAQHQAKKDPNCHTARYGIDELVYYERFTSIPAAIKREKVLKGWLRIRKLELIISTNPTWKDLSADWGKPIERYDLEAELKLKTKFPASSDLPGSVRLTANAGVLRCAQDDDVKR